MARAPRPRAAVVQSITRGRLRLGDRTTYRIWRVQPSGYRVEAHHLGGVTSLRLLPTGRITLWTLPIGVVDADFATLEEARAAVERTAELWAGDEAEVRRAGLSRRRVHWALIASGSERRRHHSHPAHPYSHPVATRHRRVRR